MSAAKRKRKNRTARRRVATFAKGLNRASQAASEAAATLGRLGGLAAAIVGGQRKGGLARARKLTPEQLSEIGRKAAAARWARPNKGATKP